LPAEPILLATRSTDKAREIRQILAPIFRARIIDLTEAGIEPHPDENDIEVFDTFLANAHAKAAWFAQRAGLPVIADDSGLSVDALGGAPGVRSRRFAERADLHGVDLDRANNERLLTELRAVPEEHRTAHYTCAAVFHLRDGRRTSALGTRSGTILHAPRGHGGFGYDPLFFDPSSAAAFAELEPALKNRRSHRAAAFRALAANLPK
jgi:XTP/dITP diphosphohydrolase